MGNISNAIQLNFDTTVKNNPDLIEQAKEDGVISKYSNKYIHKVFKKQINCPSMIQSKSTNPFKCEIYCNMKQKYQFNKQNLCHLKQFTHHENEYDNKPICRYADECKAYIRCENGVDENRIDDECHMFIYRHPPRTRQLKLAENIHSLTINKSYRDNHPLYQPTGDYLKALISEIQSNNFGSDLCLSCNKDDECKHNVYDSKYSILHIVDKKLDCLRHKLMGSPLDRGQMLALILYTGCDCNYDLCASQRNGDYKKWKSFDYCLWNAIERLSQKEIGRYPVYSGLNGVKMDTKVVTNGFFVTYVSTSWRKEVSNSFMKDNGMIIHFDEKYRDDLYIYCCDVSWISKFPDECEILFARSVQGRGRYNNFSCLVLDEVNEIQTVSLKKKEKKNKSHQRRPSLTMIDGDDDPSLSCL